MCIRDSLIPFAGGYHAEILRFLVDASACVLHFEFGLAFGAGAAFKGVASSAVAVPLVTAVGTGDVPFLGAVADMLNAVEMCIRDRYMGGQNGGQPSAEQRAEPTTCLLYTSRCV